MLEDTGYFYRYFYNKKKRTMKFSTSVALEEYGFIDIFFIIYQQNVLS